ncbi:MAG TPA: hypothetical protein VM032_02555 [Vicinamibacterales bacterium]|nr:hypothetical protein [Vicinamibacterales bacterium]
MKLNRSLIPVGALVVALGAGGWSAEAGQRDSRGRDRNGRASGGQIQERNGSGARDQGSPDQGGSRQQSGGQNRSGRAEVAPAPAPPRSYDRAERRDDRREAPRADAYRNDGRNNSYRNDTDRAYGYRNDGRTYGYRNDGRNGGYGYDPRYYGSRGYGYPSPRIIVPGRPRHYYGPGGNFSAYFGWGNGYLYGSPWSGRVYGYAAPRAYGSRIYYGDVRLQVQPRDAGVYVDGYYAGIVDDFDGVFQRLTLEVGPHQIELDAPGLEPQFFDIYVDPARTVNIRTDLFR